MKDYGIKNSWHKEVVIMESINPNINWQMRDSVYLLEALEDGTILMSFEDKLFVYCPRKKTIEGGVFSKISLAGLSYHPSFVKLQTFESERVQVGLCSEGPELIICMQFEQVYVQEHYKGKFSYKFMSKVLPKGNSHVLASFDKGGLAIGSLRSFNLALLHKWRWRFHSDRDSLWSKIIRVLHGSEGGFDPNGCAFNGIWSKIVGTSNYLHTSSILPVDSIRYQVGCGSTIRFWKDTWLGSSPLQFRYNRLFRLDRNEDCLISDRISNGLWEWNWSLDALGSRNTMYLNHLLTEISNIEVREDMDKCIWAVSQDGNFTVGSLRCLIDDHTLPSLVSKTTWEKFLPRKVNVFMWRLNLDRLPHRFNLSSRGIEIPKISCASCNGFMHYNIRRLPWRHSDPFPSDMSLGKRFPSDMSLGNLRWGSFVRDSFPSDNPQRLGGSHTEETVKVRISCQLFQHRPQSLHSVQQENDALEADVFDERTRSRSASEWRGHVLCSSSHLRLRTGTDTENKTVHQILFWDKKKRESCDKKRREEKSCDKT
ncbi:RNA-directed DNA polymerase, eukaryota, reverse transcriptase zinc-binding domain protein [Tanacetum coccineum]